MKLKCYLIPVILVLALAPALAHGSEVKPPPFVAILQAAGDPVIPPEWGGVWQNADTVSDCEGNILRYVNEEEVLCPGETYDPDEGKFPMECSGTVTGDAVDFTCTYSTTYKDCTIDYYVHIVATRVGDTFTYVEEFEITYSGPFPCDLVPGLCEVTRGTATRVGKVPKECSTATEKGSWGSVKTRYR